MKKRPIYYVFRKTLRKYKHVQKRLFTATEILLIRNLTRKLNLLERRLLRLNRVWKLGIAAAALTAWFAGPVHSQNFPPSIDISTLDGTNGFLIEGQDEDDFSGSAVSIIGDLNGDGIDDLGVGAHLADQFGNNRSGEAYIIFGRNSGFSSSFSPASLDGSNGFLIEGDQSADRLGDGISGAGDVNGDGIDDLIIGANGISGNGGAYVIFGKNTSFSDTLALSALDSTQGFVLLGINSFDLCGEAVSGAGDINGDGIDDIIIGADHADPGGKKWAGESYVVFGRNSGFGNSLSLSSLDGNNGFTIRGIYAEDFLGQDVSGAGDINGDGIDDLIIGANEADPDDTDEAGECYVIFGKTTGFDDIFDVSALDGKNGFLIKGINVNDQAGGAVSSAGDINGDGFDDLIIGAEYVNSYTGGAYVVFGKNTDFNKTLELADLDGTNGFAIQGVSQFHFAGISVSNAGDVNGDGIDDLIVGSLYAGDSYIVFGKNTAFNSSLDLSTLDGTNGFVVRNLDIADYSGEAVSGGGDINGDGIDDLVIGASGADPNGNNYAGETYVVFGRDVNTSLSTLQSTLPLEISPNPTSDIVYLNAEAFTYAHEVNITLFDPLGRAVPAPITRESGDRFQLDLKGLPQGTYLVRVITDGEGGTMRVVKE